MRLALILALAITLVACVMSRLKWKDGLHSEYKFVHFKEEFGKKYGSELEHKMRELIFNENLKRIHEINSNPKKTWKAGVNHLTDRTPGEIDAIRGYNRDLAFHTFKFTKKVLHRISYRICQLK